MELTRDGAQSVNGLAVDSLVVRIGGVLAVKDVSLNAPIGEITGLIGPNGAGKSTLINACTGLRSTASGRVEFNGRRLDRFGPAKRAQLGIGRTFQQIALIENMTAIQNVAFGCEALKAGRSALRQIFASRRDRAESMQRAIDALERCKIADLAHQQVAFLSTGQRRLVEIARAMAARFQLVCLDEPSSGLGVSETQAVASVLRNLVDETGLGILLVEHDMSMIRDLCSRLYVLDFGLLIAAGATATVLDSDIVRAAYLGQGRVA